MNVDTTGKRIKMLREEKGITQTKAAEELNMTQKKLSYYELDQREMDYETLKIVAKYYNVSTSYLLCETDYRNEDDLLEKAYYNKLKTKFGATEGDIQLALDFIKRAQERLNNK